MMLGGLGLGLLLPNLTLVAQASTPRRQLGVATAMLQSMRMVGSMLGTALVGSLISNLYVAKVNDMLVANHGSQVAHWLEDPQILVNHAGATKFLGIAISSGQNAATFLAGARYALVDAIHDSQWFIFVFIALAFWLVHRIPAVSIHGRTNEL
jgi:hypothetical protein